MIPAFDDAKHDRELRGSPLSIYLHLLDELSPVQWREVKQLALCALLGYSESTAHRALELLTSRGYLERDESAAVKAGAATRYRLVYSRPDADLARAARTA
jgi:DNA-binding IclR family transcriptional regulator